MPTAELLKPNRLNYMGRIWEKGVKEPVDLDTARALEDNPRFKVRGFGESRSRRDDDEDDAPRRPNDRGAFLSAIRGAVDNLDVDNEDAFTASGKPHPLAVSEVLGYRITAEDIDAALKQKSKPAATAEDLQPTRGAEGANGKKGTVKITRVPRDKAEKAVAAAAQSEGVSDTPQVEAEGDADNSGEGVSGDNGKDPSTDGALEV